MTKNQTCNGKKFPHTIQIYGHWYELVKLPIDSITCPCDCCSLNTLDSRINDKPELCVYNKKLRSGITCGHTKTHWYYYHLFGERDVLMCVSDMTSILKQISETGCVDRRKIKKVLSKYNIWITACSLKEKAVLNREFKNVRPKIVRDQGPFVK